MRRNALAVGQMIITLGLVILAVAMYPEDPEAAIFAGILAVLSHLHPGA